MGTKGQQMEFEITPKDNRTNYAYLSEIKGDGRDEASTVNVVFSHQSVIVILICLIMSLIATFSLGVEKGKLIAKNSAASEKTPQATEAQKTQDLATLATGVPPAPKSEDVLAKAPATQKTSVPPATIEQAAEPAALPAGGYTIQVASVKSKGSAQGLSETLTKKGISSFTKESGKYFIVLAGNYAKKEDAQANLKELKKTYKDCFIKEI